MVDPIFNGKPRLLIKDGQLLTTSLVVAQLFEKQHKHVLRDIRNIFMKAGDWSAQNFQKVKEQMSYRNSAGVIVEMETSRTGHYTMTSRGFLVLVMGFTGAQALIRKLPYTDAFVQRAALEEAAKFTALFSEMEYRQVFALQVGEFGTIKHLGCSADFAQLNFKLSLYINELAKEKLPNSRSQPGCNNFSTGEHHD